MPFFARLIAWLKTRFPSWAEVLRLFWVVLAVNNVWAFFIYSKNLDRWVRALTLWELVGVGAYTLAQALLDSLLQVACLVLLAGVLPPALLSKRFAAHGFAWYLAVFGSLNVYYNLAAPFTGNKQAALLAALLCLILAFVCWLLTRYKFPQKAGEFILPRLTVLSVFYLAADLAGVVIVLARNLFPAY